MNDTQSQTGSLDSGSQDFRDNVTAAADVTAVVDDVSTEADVTTAADVTAVADEATARADDVT